MAESAIFSLRQQIIANIRLALPIMRPDLNAESSSLRVTNYGINPNICAVVLFGHNPTSVVVKSWPCHSISNALRNLLHMTEEYLRHNQPYHGHNVNFCYQFPQQQFHGHGQVSSPLVMDDHGRWMSQQNSQMQGGQMFPSFQQPFNAGNFTNLPNPNFMMGNAPPFNAFQANNPVDAGQFNNQQPFLPVNMFQTNNSAVDAGQFNNRPIPPFVEFQANNPAVDRGQVNNQSNMRAFTASEWSQLQFLLFDEAQCNRPAAEGGPFCSDFILNFRPSPSPSPSPVPHIDSYLAAANAAAMNAIDHMGADADGPSAEDMPWEEENVPRDANGCVISTTPAELQHFIAWGFMPGERERKKSLALSRKSSLDTPGVERWRQDSTEVLQHPLPPKPPQVNKCTNVGKATPVVPAPMTAARIPCVLPPAPHAGHAGLNNKGSNGKMDGSSTETAKNYYAGVKSSPKQMNCGPTGNTAVKNSFKEKNSVDEKMSTPDNKMIQGSIGYEAGHGGQSSKASADSSEMTDNSTKVPAQAEPEMVQDKLRRMDKMIQ